MSQIEMYNIYSGTRCFAVDFAAGSFRYVKKEGTDAQTRLEAMQASFEMYLPDQYDLAMEGKIVENGKYVMLVISQDNDAVINKFNEMLTAK